MAPATGEQANCERMSKARAKSSGVTALMRRGSRNCYIHLRAHPNDPNVFPHRIGSVCVHRAVANSCLRHWRDSPKAPPQMHCLPRLGRTSIFIPSIVSNVPHDLHQSMHQLVLLVFGTRSQLLQAAGFREQLTTSLASARAGNHRRKPRACSFRQGVNFLAMSVSNSGIATFQGCPIKDWSLSCQLMIQGSIYFPFSRKFWDILAHEETHRS